MSHLIQDWTKKECKQEVIRLRVQLATLRRERDEANAKFTELNKSLMVELRDPSGTIWEHAKALQKERDELSKQYHELLYAVARKHEGETRHQTALRYIQQTEANCCSGPADSARAKQGEGQT